MGTKTKLKRPPNLKGVWLDRGIAGLVIGLNWAGLTTYISCAGHRSAPPGKGWGRGFIGFMGYRDKEGIVKICELYGLTNIKIRYRIEHSQLYKEQIQDSEWHRGEATMVSFDPIGKPWSYADPFEDVYDPLDHCEYQLELFKGYVETYW